MKGNETQNKKGKKIKFIVVIVMILILIRIVSAIVIFYKPVKPSGKRPFDIGNDSVRNGETIDSNKTSKNEAQPVTIIISSNPVFENAKSKGNWSIVSSKTNKGLLMQVEVIDKKTGNMIYVTPLLEAEQNIGEDYLRDKTLSAGKYKARANFYFYYKEDKSLYYSTAVDIDIDILN